ncbi:hypothetical protein C4J83_2186 [Pseudomonas sp. LBUM920]|nr:hypothetical protein C4J83_2186 [Pseudomonas sp. LBUM920]
MRSRYEAAENMDEKDETKISQSISTQQKFEPSLNTLT